MRWCLYECNSECHVVYLHLHKMHLARQWHCIAIHIEGMCQHIKTWNKIRIVRMMALDKTLNTLAVRALLKVFQSHLTNYFCVFVMYFFLDSSMHFLRHGHPRGAALKTRRLISEPCSTISKIIWTTGISHVNRNGLFETLGNTSCDVPDRQKYSIYVGPSEQKLYQVIFRGIGGRPFLWIGTELNIKFKSFKSLYKWSLACQLLSAKRYFHK